MTCFNPAESKKACISKQVCIARLNICQPHAYRWTILISCLLMGAAIGHTGAAKHFFHFGGGAGGGLTVDSTLSKSFFFWKKKCSRE